jgi:S-adenosylmethionine-diacylgycerolhomoserine-N-methlytransferase
MSHSAGTGDAKSNMDNMYRYTRHVYDLTRKYYLFGRDRLIAELPVGKDELICEVGCGTARNLIQLAKKHPSVRFYGVDASTEMLKTADANVRSSGLDGRVVVATALAQDFDGGMQFGLTKPFDRLIFSYALSIMDDWKAAADHALTQLKPGGTIHVVDFGDQEGMPGWFKKLLGGWLAQFHVRFRPEVRAHFEALERAGQGKVTYRSVMRGYAYRLDFIKAA